MGLEECKAGYTIRMLVARDENMGRDPAKRDDLMTRVKAGKEGVDRGDDGVGIVNVSDGLKGAEGV